jgi:hypothetical protein
LKNRGGLNYAGIWTPALYAIDSGWDYHRVEAVARLGASREDVGGLTEQQQAELLEWCRQKANKWAKEQA